MTPCLIEARGYGKSWGFERAAPLGGKPLPGCWREGLLEALRLSHFVLGPCSESILVLLFFSSPAWDRPGGRQVPGLGAVCMPRRGHVGHPRTPQGAPFWGRTGPEPLEQMAAVSRPVPVTSWSPAPSSIAAALSPFVSARFRRCRCLDLPAAGRGQRWAHRCGTGGLWGSCGGRDPIVPSVWFPWGGQS